MSAGIGRKAATAQTLIVQSAEAMEHVHCAQVTIYSLVNSLTQGTGVGKVQISINGENHVKYMQTVDLSQPLEADLGWNEEKK